MDVGEHEHGKRAQYEAGHCRATYLQHNCCCGTGTAADDAIKSRPEPLAESDWEPAAEWHSEGLKQKRPQKRRSGGLLRHHGREENWAAPLG